MTVIVLQESAVASKADPRPPGFWWWFAWFAPAVTVLLAVNLHHTGVVL
jgi:hypothetical protein